MQTIRNKTRRPLKIALPRGKTLHLGPASLAQIQDDTLNHPAVRKILEAGEIEVVSPDEGSPGPASGTPTRVHESTHGHAGTRSQPRKGDR